MVGCRCASGLASLSHNADHDVADLIAFRADKPGKWWRRTGAVPILNFEAVEHAEYFKSALRILSTPLEWLRAGGIGCVILDNQIDLRFWLGGVPTIDADTVELASAIERRMRTVVKLPTFRVPRIAA